MLDVKIFIIDDEEEMCSSIQEALQQNNIFSDFSFSPSEGLKKLKEDSFDILLLDFKLPEMNGFEFIDVLSKDETFKHLKIIMMTAYGDTSTGLDAIKKALIP